VFCDYHVTVSCVADNWKDFSLYAFRAKVSTEGNSYMGRQSCRPRKDVEGTRVLSGPIGTDPYQSQCSSTIFPA